LPLKAKFHYAIWFEAGLKLVADLQQLASSELARASRYATNFESASKFEPASNQISYMEFGFKVIPVARLLVCSVVFR